MTDLTLEAALAHSRPLTGWLEEDEAATLYRHVADLGASPPGLWLVDGQSQSGQVHTAHYGC